MEALIKQIPNLSNWVYYDSEKELGLIAEVVDTRIAKN